MKTLEKFKHIPTFDNSFVDPAIPTTSISTIIGMLVEPFNQREVAEKTFNKHFNNTESQYYNKTVDQIIEMWAAKGAESLRYGRLNDEYIGIVLEGDETDYELYDLDNDVENDERLKIQVESFNQFIEDNQNRYKYIAREQTLFYRLGDHYIKGRFDALLFDNVSNKYLIVDWKTSGSVDTIPNKWTDKMLGAAKIYDNLNWNSYTIQVYFYKTALIESGYLPAAVTYDDIDVCIVNLPGKQFSDGKYYRKYDAAFAYDKDTLDKIFNFGIKKNMILNKK